MTDSLALIGFGEAAQIFCKQAAWGRSASAFDIKTTAEESSAESMRRAYRLHGVQATNSATEALAGARNVLSLVTADQALKAAENAARSIAAGAYYFDMNSVAPDTKRNASHVLHEASAIYIDTAIMAPVDPLGLNVPLLLSGQHAESGAARLAGLGFTQVRCVGSEIGRASTIKMVRSVLIKGLEAVTAEWMIAAIAAGVVDEMLASAGGDWGDRANYNLERMLRHGTRRATEMKEVAKTLESLGVSPLMTRSVAGWQSQLGDLQLDPIPDSLTAKLSQILRIKHEVSA